MSSPILVGDAFRLTLCQRFTTTDIYTIGRNKHIPEPAVPSCRFTSSIEFVIELKPPKTTAIPANSSQDQGPYFPRSSSYTARHHLTPCTDILPPTRLRKVFNHTKVPRAHAFRDPSWPQICANVAGDILAGWLHHDEQRRDSLQDIRLLEIPTLSHPAPHFELPHGFWLLVDTHY
jgi:hypothetical protein